MVPYLQISHSIPAEITKLRGRITVKQENRNFYMVPYLQIFAPGAALWWF